MLDARRYSWPQKAAALGALATEGASSPQVQAIAARLALAGLDATHAARRIATEVAELVQYQREPGDTFADVHAILTSGVDDCDGHAVLAAAIATAAGHTARVVGLALPGDALPRHVRAELQGPDGWHSMDSTPDAARQGVRVVPPVGAVGAPAVHGWIGDLVSVVTAPLRFVAAGARYVVTGQIIRDVADLVARPAFLASVAAVVGCSAASGGVLAPVCAQSSLSWAVIGAETVQAVGRRWEAYTEEQVAQQIRRATDRVGMSDMAARMLAAERALMAQRTPQQRMQADMNIARDAILHMQRFGRAVTQQWLLHRAGGLMARTEQLRYHPDLPPVPAWARVVLAMLAASQMDVRGDARRAWDWAIRRSDERRQAAVLDSLAEVARRHARPKKRVTQPKGAPRRTPKRITRPKTRESEAHRRARTGTGKRIIDAKALETMAHRRARTGTGKRIIETKTRETAAHRLARSMQPRSHETEAHRLARAARPAPPPPAPASKGGGGGVAAAGLSLGLFFIIRKVVAA